MKKTLLATLIVAMLLVSAFVMPSTTASAAGEYVIFGNGDFQNGGSILSGCGTVIKDGALVGGEGLNNGAAGNGWFQITIDGTGSDAAFQAYKYLAITGEPVIMDNSTGAYNGGTVQFGAGNTYNFPDIEASGKKMGAIAKSDTYYLDLSKVSTFEANWLLLSHCAVGYKITDMWLTDTAEGGAPSGGGDTPSGGGDTHQAAEAVTAQVLATM
jgi:hypothetical protein